jgi:uncharacterized membrane protein YkvA (DUF1232 family)
MDRWQIAVIGLLVVAGVSVVALALCLRWTARSPIEAAAEPRPPRRARWWLIGLALYVASPIDPIPDFLPGIGHLDELILVPLVLARVRRMIPPAVWREHFLPCVGSVKESPVRPELPDHAAPDGDETPAAAPDPS